MTLQRRRRVVNTYTLELMLCWELDNVVVSLWSRYWQSQAHSVTESRELVASVCHQPPGSIVSAGVAGTRLQTAASIVTRQQWALPWLWSLATSGHSTFLASSAVAMSRCQHIASGGTMPQSGHCTAKPVRSTTQASCWWRGILHLHRSLKNII